MTEKKQKALYEEVRRKRRLETAWKRVRDNARKSRSKRTRSEVEDFEADIHRNLNSIQGKLIQDSFVFRPSRGWPEPAKDPKKPPRPIVITPVPSRIVQRAILDVLLEQVGIQEFVNQPFSFGGVKKQDPEAAAAVPGAIKAAAFSILEGNPNFVRSDISGFFRKIPKHDVIEKIAVCIDDERFCNLIKQAIAVELSNLEELREHADLFPLEDIGVAQGCALSPLFGNILLSEFDRQLNAGACTCIRYIDDFLILGPSETAVSEYFAAAIEHLHGFQMDAYDPSVRPDKAERGNANKEGLEFLGVEIVNGSIRPSKKNRGNLITSVNEIIHDHTRTVPPDDKSAVWKYNHSFMKCLFTINAVVSGWGNQYYFCNDRKIVDDLDSKIDNLLSKASDDFRSLLRGLGPIGRRRLLGVKSLHDCKVQPIVWKRMASA